MRYYYTVELAALDQMTGSTSGPVDNMRNALVLRATRGTPLEADARAMILAKREAHRTWQFLTQRRWQADTRRESRARHHDSVAIREKYVRCHP